MAVHSWDIHGAHATGMVTGWCSRLEGTFPDIYNKPDLIGPDLVTVSSALLARSG